MARTSLRCVLVAAVLAVSAVAGCAGPAGPAPGGTGSATTATTVSSPGISVAPGTPWHLVFISSSAGYGVADLYARRAEKALGVTVQVTDWALGGLTVSDALAQVRGGATQVAQAQIVVVFAGPDGTSDNPMVNPDTSPCIYGTGALRPVTMADWAPYGAAMGVLYQEIWRLRGGRPTVLRAVDVYNPVVSQWRAKGIERACTAMQDLMSATLRRAAVANGATLASVYDAMNGKDHTQDPRLKGYIGPDGIHTTAQGAAVIADTLAAVGFAANTDPVATTAAASTSG